MFKERKNPSTKVGVVREFVPHVGITKDALAKMQIYVEECPYEIGWLGTAYHDSKHNNFIIQDVYLFDQDVHSTTTEITPEGLEDFATELISQGDTGIEIWNNLKMWGHSHVNMDVSPSGQDNDQMKTFKEGGHDWFIRLIANKKGDMKIDLYDYQTGVTYLDLPWVEIASEEERAIQAQIDELYEALALLEEQRVERYKEDIKEEMKEKVRRIVYQTTLVNTKKNEAKREKENGKEKNEHIFKNTYDEEEYWYNKYYYGSPEYDDDDKIDTDNDVFNYFNKPELIELAECHDLEELDIELYYFGYNDFFTLNDLETIYRVAKKLQGGSYHV